MRPGGWAFTGVSRHPSIWEDPYEIAARLSTLDTMALETQSVFQRLAKA